MQLMEKLLSDRHIKNELYHCAYCDSHCKTKLYAVRENQISYALFNISTMMVVVTTMQLA